MEYDEDELLLLKEAKEHPVGKFTGVEKQPGLAERFVNICRNLAKTAFSKTDKSQQNDQIEQNDHLRYR